MNFRCIKKYCLLTNKRNALYTVLGVLKTADYTGMPQHSDEKYFPRGDRTGGV
jgi:hypothetical protein